MNANTTTTDLDAIDLIDANLLDTLAAITQIDLLDSFDHESHAASTTPQAFGDSACWDLPF